MTYSKLSALQPFWSISMGFHSPASGCPSSRRVVANTSRNLSPETKKKNVITKTYFTIINKWHSLTGLAKFKFIFYNKTRFGNYKKTCLSNWKTCSTLINAMYYFHIIIWVYFFNFKVTRINLVQLYVYWILAFKYK